MLIHAYKRKEATPVDTGRSQIEFKLNDAGEVVAEVDDEGDIATLLNIPEAYRAHESAAKPAQAKQTAPVLSEEQIEAARKEAADVLAAEAAAKAAFVLVGEDGKTLDLNAMDDDALKAFAKANNIALHHTQKGDKARQKISEALQTEG